MGGTIQSSGGGGGGLNPVQRGTLKFLVHVYIEQFLKKIIYFLQSPHKIDACDSGLI